MTEVRFQCSRCLKSGPRLPEGPVPGPVGREVAEKVCADCWQEWTQAEVMVINELRLNFMEAKSLQILEQHMREFLMLEPLARETD
jgi:Fe-S cluster biosynthesis and repair protein YggX